MRLYLVRHAAIAVRPDRPSASWHLSPEGRSGAAALAEEQCWTDVSLVYTSPEPKAVATAQRIAAKHGLRIAIDRDLREVEGRAWTSGDYSAVARRYLSGEAVDGWETRAAALKRFRAAIDAIHRRHANEAVAVASHGLVLTLWLAGLLRLDEAATCDRWSRIRFPDLAIVDPAARRLERDFGG